MRIVIEIENDRDANLVISLAKRLKGKILEESKSISKAKKGKAINPVAHLESISKGGGISSKPNPSDWQKNERQGCEL